MEESITPVWFKWCYNWRQQDFATVSPFVQENRVRYAQIRTSKTFSNASFSLYTLGTVK